MKKKNAIILGGTHDHIRLSEILKADGFHTTLVDYLENPPCKRFADAHIQESTADKEKILDIARQLEAHAVFAACIDRSLLSMAYVCENLGLKCPFSYSTARALTNKILMKEKLKADGIPTSDYCVIRDVDWNGDVELRYPLVIKPADANSSKGITKATNCREMKAALPDAFHHSSVGEVVIEEFHEGREYSADFVIRDSQPELLLLTETRKSNLNDQHFTIVQSQHPAGTPDLTRRISNIACQITASFALTEGPLLIQLIESSGELSVIEFGARIGGGSKHYLIEAVTGFDILRYYTKLLVGKTYTTPVSCKHRYACINYVYTNPGRIKSFDGFELMEVSGVIDRSFFYKTEGMLVTGNISSGDRAAGYLMVDDDPAALRNRIELADQHLRVLTDLDRDIMIHGLHTISEASGTAL
ncbi:MAG: ATP-grasp domain-containing protein [Gammaproteobacteria bacterium]|nr:ATP-grasp domain-containing protein [Gammaproteobacteria bacterium]